MCDVTKTTPPPGDPARDDAAVERFIERFAASLAEAGMTRMPARVFATLLAADEGARTSAELADQLRVSPAAISGAVRYLVQVGLVARDREPGGRRDIYRLYSDVWYEIFARRDQQMTRWVDNMREGVAAVGPGTPAGRRLTETMGFFDYLRTELPLLIDRWHQQSRD
jgi:DNA-binding transcriptional regulator GbsR (MarR family)